MANTLKDGEVFHMQGSGKKPYELKNAGGVYSCTCPAWRNQSVALDVRSCKHLRKHLGDAHEDARIGKAPTASRPLAVGEAPDKKVKGKTIAEVKGYDVQEVLDRAAKEGRKLRPDEKAKIAGPPIMLAHKFENDFDPAGWWFSEKMDGVRAWWDGTNLISRQGNVYHAPDWFKSRFPSFPLDGELWIERQAFQETISIVKRLEADERWKRVSFVVFDMPHHTGTFEERIEALEAWHHQECAPYVKIHSQMKVRDHKHLADELKQYVKLGAEGLMLRRPSSPYEVGRSYHLLKVKIFQDAEAEVIGYTDGKGRHKGVVGALMVRTPEGVEFNIGTGLNDADRRNPPPIGSSVTYTFTEHSDDGVPKFAAYVRIRPVE
jgi:DNA ligase-1